MICLTVSLLGSALGFPPVDWLLTHFASALVLVKSINVHSSSTESVLPSKCLEGSSHRKAPVLAVSSPLWGWRTVPEGTSIPLPVPSQTLSLCNKSLPECLTKSREENHYIVTTVYFRNAGHNFKCCPPKDSTLKLTCAMKYAKQNENQLPAFYDWLKC
jgi:hypothetical protein